MSIFDVVLGDLELSLRAAQLDVVARRFRQHGDQRAAPLILGQLHLRVRRLDLPAHLAPEVELPGRVEADVVVVDRRDARARAAVQRAEQADDAVVAIEFALIFRRRR